jgi:regulator of protease activity HflC (stomatin/prohibitin superfamily)
VKSLCPIDSSGGKLFVEDEYCTAMLSQRDKINLRLQEIIDRQTDPWGIKVIAVEVRDVILPDSMKRAMAGQAESERERRAKIINAEAEFQAASFSISRRLLEDRMSPLTR